MRLTGNQVSLLAGAVKRRKKDANKYRDNANDNQKLDKSKPGFAAFSRWPNDPENISQIRRHEDAPMYANL
ncbi:MAG TPA: hypothetical protein VHX86_12505 [Tepidisphaeraceae bacterium]|nr:hypothetical protein [Tepidisphaeraceae bacterium]